RRVLFRSASAAASAAAWSPACRASAYSRVWTTWPCQRLRMAACRAGAEAVDDDAMAWTPSCAWAAGVASAAGHASRPVEAARKKERRKGDMATCRWHRDTATRPSWPHRRYVAYPYV